VAIFSASVTSLSKPDGVEQQQCGQERRRAMRM